MNSWTTTKLLIWIVAASLLIATSANIAIAAEQPWDGPAFSARGADIVTAVRGLTTIRNSEVAVLLEESRIVVDESGREAYTHRLVYRIGTQAPGNWSAMSVLWNPTRQQRPELRARVISADGRETTLDSSTISESPANETGQDTFGDNRVLRAPLPTIAPGAIVELQTVVKDTQPIFDRGILQTVPFGKLNYVLRTTLVIDVPSATPLKYELRYLPDVKPVSTTSNGRTVVTFESGAMNALDPLEVNWISGESRVPRVSFSTASSWRDIASRYAAIVDSSISKSDVSALTREAVGSATIREEVIEKILQKVQRTVRYTAVQLGAAGIIPTSPSETLNLEYGDCKDQASLIVAMLRSAGIKAHVALLRVSPDMEIEESLPGFGGFDHAIVYIPGDKPVWIDSTTRFSRGGQLPTEDQGRLALIASSDSTSLQRIPIVAGSVVNSIEIHFAETGPAKMSIAKEFHGTEEVEARSSHGAVENSDAEEVFESTANALYNGDGILNFKRSDPSDFSHAFRVQYDVVNSSQARSESGTAEFEIDISNLLAESGIGLIAALDDKLTKNGIDLHALSSQDWTYSINAPPGYQKGAMPPKKTWKLGPATISSEFELKSDGTVTGAIHLDQGKRVYRAEDVAAVTAALKGLDDTSTLTVSFELTANGLYEEGRITESFAEFRKLIELHPNESLHHEQLALAMIKAGMGESARSETQKSVTVEPENPVSWNTLGSVHLFDLTGRYLKSGFDRKQARDAFEKSLRISSDKDSSAFTAHVNLGTLLEMNDRGERYGAGADLNSAVEHFKQVETRLGSNSAARNALYFDLLQLQRFDELKNSSLPAQFRLAAIAASDGVPAAVRESGKLDASARQNALSSAANHLQLLRLYETADELVQAGTRAGLNLQRMTGFGSDSEAILQRSEQVHMSANDPSSVAKRMIVEMFKGDRGALNKILSTAGQAELQARPDMPLFLSSELERDLYLAQTGPVLIDALVSSTPRVDGNDKTGYQVEFKVPSGTMHIYVVRESGEFKILTAGRKDFALARGALRFIERADLESARQWLDWIDEDLVRTKDANPYSVDAFNSTWLVALQKSRDRMRFSAATVLSSSAEDLPNVLPILLEGQQKTTGETHDAISLAYATGLMTLQRYDECFKVGTDILRTSPRSDSIFLAAQCAFETGKLDELKTVVQNNLKTIVEQRKAVLLLAAIDVRQNNFSAAETRVRNYVQSAKPSRNDESVIAWFSLYHATVTDADISPVQSAATKTPDPISLRTLAALKAEMGKPLEAMNAFRSYLDLVRKPSLDPDDWFILGRIYEGYDEKEAAAVAYRKVTRTASQVTYDAAYALAQRRLALISR